MTEYNMRLVDTARVWTFRFFIFTSININIAGTINSQIITLAYIALFYIFF